MSSAAPTAPALRAGRDPHRAAMAGLVSWSLLAAALAVVVAFFALESTGVTDVGDGWWAAIATALVLVVPVVALVALALSALVGVLVALVDRTFSLRRLYACTAASMVTSGLVSAVGAALVLTGDTPVALVSPGVGLVNMVVAGLYGVLLHRYAGVARPAALGLAALLALLVLASTLVGVLGA